MTVSFKKLASSGTLNYSIDEGNTWNVLESNVATPSVNAGEKIMFKGDMIPAMYNGIGKYNSTKNFDVSGNAMSLLYGDDFVGRTDSVLQNFTFFYLFSGCATVVNAKDLILPATTLANYCYNGMFQNCTSLKSAPSILPATTLAYGNQCYHSMFRGCTSLTSAPELPATTLASSCYNSMFYGCTSLTNAPELPATTLESGCYQTMFYDCTSLKHIKMLATSISASGCLDNWVSNVSSTGTFVKSTGVEIPTGTSGIPEGWTVVEE